MNRFFKVLAFAAAALSVVSAQAAATGPATGNCQAQAVGISMSTSDPTRRVTLVDGWDSEFDMPTYWGAYWFAAPLKKGHAYTVWITDSSSELVGVDFQYDWMSSFAYFSSKTIGGKTYYVMESSSWSASDKDTTYYMNITGPVGTTLTFHYCEGLVLPTGIPENPEPLTVPDGSYSSVVRATLGENNAYYYTTTLTAGRRYQFKTTNGTADAAVSVEIQGGDGISQMAEPTEISVGDHNKGFDFIPLQTGLYTLIVHSEAIGGDVSLSYGSKAGRSPADHKTTPLAVDSEVAFTPGYMNAPGGQYYDAVIDQQLFSFTAKAGTRYLAETAGAESDLIMIVYDAQGNVLAQNTTRGGGSKDVLAAFQAPANGTYYVGVCENIPEGSSKAPLGKEIRLSLVDLSTVETADDKYDPADDELGGANPIVPTLTANAYANPSTVGATHSGHTLSRTDWTDCFAFAARAGLEYRFKAVSAAGKDTGLKLKAEVSRANGDVEKGDVEGDLSPEANGWLSVSATANDTYYVKVSVEEGNGLAYPVYSLNSCVFTEDAEGYGMLTVVAKGPSSDAGATWRLSGSDEPNYPFGLTIPCSGDVTVVFSAVSGFATPGQVSVKMGGGEAQTVTGLYKDTFDPGDDESTGAVQLNITATEQPPVRRTLWAEGANPDKADWFKFSAEAGKYYTFKFTERVGAPMFTLCDSAMNELASDISIVSVLAPVSGTYYLKVSHVNELAPVDSSYAFTCFSANVGMVRFDKTAITVSDAADYVDFTLRRTTSEGTVRVCYGTVADTAEAGFAYEPVGGELVWQSGDATDKTVRVKLLGKGGSAIFAKDLKFHLKIAAPTPDEVKEGEFAPGIEGTGLSTVTIAASPVGDKTGILALTAWGVDKKAFASPSAPEVTVAPGTALRLWVSRTGGTDGEQVAFFSLDNPDFASIGLNGGLAWSDGDAADKSVVVRVNSGIQEAGSFNVSLMSANLLGGEIGKVKVNVDPALPDPSGKDEPETGKVQLAAGVHKGVLTERTQSAECAAMDLAEIEVVVGADSNVTAKVTSSALLSTQFSGKLTSVSTVDGTAAVTLFNTTDVDGLTYTNRLSLAFDNSSAAALGNLDVGVEWAELLVNVPNSDGITVTRLEYEGSLYRDSRSIPAARQVIADAAGNYVVTLPPSASEGFGPEGDGFLTVTVATDGSATVSGVLADGTEIPKYTTFVGLCDNFGGMELALPVFRADALQAFGGTLFISASAGSYAVNGEVFWSCGGYESDSYFRQALDAEGEQVDPTESLSYLLRDYDLSAEPGGASVVATIGGFALDSEAGSISIDRETGLISGELGGFLFRGVLLMNRMRFIFGEAVPFNVAAGIIEDASAADAQVNYTRFAIRAEKVDRDRSENWGFRSTITFDGNGNTSGAVPSPVTAEVNAEVVLPQLAPEFRRTGYVFTCWRDAAGNDYHPGETISQPPADLTLTAVWSFSVEGIPEALDCEGKGYVFVGGGNAPWYPTTDKVHSGGTSIRSGAIKNNQTTWLETRVEGPGVVSFFWAVSSEQTFDKLKFSVDGSAVKSIDGVKGWAEVVYEITTPGIHVLRWTYAKDGSGGSGQDCGWVDKFAFGPTVMVAFDANGGHVSEASRKVIVDAPFGTLPEATWDLWDFDGWKGNDGIVYTAESNAPPYALTLTAQWKAKLWTVTFDGNGADSGAAPTATNQYTGLTVLVPGRGTLTRNGFEFKGWNDGVRDYKPGDEYVIGTANVTLKANWSLSVAGVAEAMDCEKDFMAGGNAGWFPQADYYVFGTSAIQSGTLANGQNAWLSTQVEGPGMVGFFWAVSSRANYDKLTFAVDGQVVKTISGEVEWTEVQYEIMTEGTHTLQWKYEKSTVGGQGADCAWLDKFTFGPTIEVTFDPGEYGTLPDSERTKRYVIGSEFAHLPVPTSAVKDFTGWYDGAKLIRDGDTVPSDPLDLIATWGPKTWKVTYDANGGSGTMSGTNDFEGVEIVLAACTFAKEGNEFAGWITPDGSLLQPGAKYRLAQSDVVMKAKWTLSVKGVAEALGCPERTFTADGAAAWYPDGNQVVSGKIGNNQKSILETVVEGAGMVMFDWTVSSEKNFDALAFLIDDVVVKKISGEIGWQGFDYEITSAGAHKLTWRYSKDPSGSEGADCGAIAAFRFGPTVEVTFDPGDFGVMPESEKVRRYVVGTAFGTLPELTSDIRDFGGWWRDENTQVTAADIVPDVDITLTALWNAKTWRIIFDANGGSGDMDPVRALEGEDVMLPPCAFTKAGNVFAGWEDSRGGIHQPGSLFVMGAKDSVLKAKWTFTTAGIAEAFGCPDRTFTTTGNAAWHPDVSQEFITSGKVGNNEKSVLETKIAEQGILTFVWAVSSEQGADKLAFVVDDKTDSEISGTVDWTPVTYEFTDAQPHTVRWVYMKDGGGASGMDCGSLRDFVFKRTVDVMFIPGEGGTLPDSETLKRYVIGEKFGTLPEPTPTDRTKSFYCWEDVSGNEVAVTNTVPDENPLILTARWGDKQWRVTFDANGGEGDPIVPLRGFTGDKVTIPSNTFAKAGYDFIAWTDENGNAWYPDDEFTIGDIDVLMTAKWGFSTRGIAEALGCPGLKFETTGDAPWAPADGCAVSGKVGNNRKSELSTTVKGAGTVSFEWSSSSELNFDKLTFFIDGKAKGSISGETPWTYKEYELPDEGAHTLSWRYSKDYGGSSGSDAGWLRNFRFKRNVEPMIDFSGVSLPLAEGTTAADLCIVEGPFANSGLAELNRLVAWAKANEVLVVTVNQEMDFDQSGNPLTLASTAYLLNCKPTQDAVDSALAAFRIPSITCNLSGGWDVARPVGDFNGNIKMLKAHEPTGPWSEESEAIGGRLFFKALLVR